jgi:hypothetical protein
LGRKEQSRTKKRTEKNPKRLHQLERESAKILPNKKALIILIIIIEASDKSPQKVKQPQTLPPAQAIPVPKSQSHLGGKAKGLDGKSICSTKAA